MTVTKEVVMKVIIASVLLVFACSPFHAARARHGDESPIAFDAGRALNAEEVEQLMRWTLQLLDERQTIYQRAEAAKAIGEQLPHRGAIPVLAAVLSDRDTHTFVRRAALVSLSQIPGNAVVPLVIAAVSDSEAGIRARAVEQLRKLSATVAVPHARIDREDANLADIEIAAIYWRDWWKASEKTYVHNRGNMLSER